LGPGGPAVLAEDLKRGGESKREGRGIVYQGEESRWQQCEKTTRSVTTTVG